MYLVSHSPQETVGKSSSNNATARHHQRHDDGRAVASGVFRVTGACLEAKVN